MARSNSPNPVASASHAGSLFFPQREILGLDRDRFSPAVKTKAVLVAAEVNSFDRAATVLEKIGEIKISGRHIGRLAHEAGERLLERQRERAEQFQSKQLPVEVENIPHVAVVEMDGGRIRTRAEGQGTGAHDPRWRESKNALFQRMTSQSHETDPCPELPDFLENRGHVRQLVLEMSGTADGIEAPPEEQPRAAEPIRYEPPKRVLRTCLSSLDDSKRFGKLMAAEAHRKSPNPPWRRLLRGAAAGVRGRWHEVQLGRAEKALSDIHADRRFAARR